MRAAIENWLTGRWYSSQKPAWYLRALEPVYRAAWQRAKRRASPQRATAAGRVPQVVVGNITVGGSGKTPLVIALCQLAKEMDLKPGIASTGYGRHSRATLLVKPGDDPRLSGDEPLLMAQRTAAPVVVAQRRLEAMHQLNGMDVDLVISDDGLQQPGISWDIKIYVIDGERGSGNGHLLPAGPLREPLDSLFNADYVISKGEWAAQPPGITSSTMHLQARDICSLDKKCSVEMTQFIQQQSGRPVHAVAGTGNPWQFFQSLNQHGLATIQHGFADHHAYRKGDFDRMDDRYAIIMTEKDAVKCCQLELKNAWYLPVEAHLPETFKCQFKARLGQLLKEH